MRSAIERKDMTVRNRLFVAWLILARFVMLSIYGCATQRQVIQDRRLTEQEVTDMSERSPTQNMNRVMEITRSYGKVLSGESRQICATHCRLRARQKDDFDSESTRP